MMLSSCLFCVNQLSELSLWGPQALFLYFAAELSSENCVFQLLLVKQPPLRLYLLALSHWLLKAWKVIFSQAGRYWELVGLVLQPLFCSTCQTESTVSPSEMT